MMIRIGESSWQIEVFFSSIFLYTFVCEDNYYNI